MRVVVDTAEALRVDVAVASASSTGSCGRAAPGSSRRSAPPSSRCVANACRSRCGWARAGAASRCRGAGRAPRGTARPRRRGRARGRAVAQVARDPVRRLLAERHDAVLRALAVADVDELLLEVDVAEVEPDRLGAAQPGGVDELEQRAVAERRAAPSPPSAVEHLARPRPASARRAAAAARRGASGISGTRPARARSGAASAPPPARARSSPARACRPAARGRARQCSRRARARRRARAGRPRRTTRRSRAGRRGTRAGSRRRCRRRRESARMSASNVTRLEFAPSLRSPADMDDRLIALAELAVHGANVQPGQVVAVSAELGQEELARAVAEAGYKRGAIFVDVVYFDPYVKRARIEHADPETLDVRARVVRRARVDRSPSAATRASRWPASSTRPSRASTPRCSAGPAARLRSPRRSSASGRRTGRSSRARTRLGEARLPGARRAGRVRAALAGARCTCCGSTSPTRPRRGTSGSRCCGARPTRLSERNFDAIELSGPGTELTVGLLPSSRWWAGDFTTRDGLRHLPNLPTEEVFTTPDPARTEGHVTSTQPLVLKDGTIVRGLRVRFEGGRAVEVTADENGGAIRARTGVDEGAARLGELALVDGRAASARSARLLRHAARRERRQPHRPRLRLPVRGRGRRRRPREPERDAHRLHDRLAGARGHGVAAEGDPCRCSAAATGRSGRRRGPAAVIRTMRRHGDTPGRRSSRGCTGSAARAATSLGTRRCREIYMARPRARRRACSPRAAARRRHRPVHTGRSPQGQVPRRARRLRGPDLVGQGEPAAVRGALRRAAREGRRALARRPLRDRRLGRADPAHRLGPPRGHRPPVPRAVCEDDVHRAARGGAASASSREVLALHAPGCEAAPERSMARAPARSSCCIRRRTSC